MLKFFNIYQNNMVFQQGRPIIICGFGEGKVKVSVSHCGETESVTVFAENGEWRAELPERCAGTGFCIIAESGSEKTEITDVAVGEVWLLSGQSNMECTLEYCTGTEEYIEKLGSVDVRFLDIECDISFSPRKNGEKIKWKKQTPESALNFSAIGGIFGYILGEKLGVPIGLIKNYRGGNCIATFLSEEKLRSRPENREWINRFEDEKKELKSAWSMVPTGLYNAMTVPLEPLRIRGVLWYQGESDSAEGRHVSYPYMLKDLTVQWREMFDDENLPVLSVMLPPFSQPPFNYKLVRQIQLEYARADENVQLISAADLGPGVDDEGEFGIHPKFKTPISERAALIAFSFVYHMDMGTWNAPSVKKIERCGDKLRISFSFTGKGLRAEPELKGFTASDDGVDFYEPKAELLDDCVVIHHCEKIKKICYCYINSSDDQSTLGGTLTNETGIPAFPFEADVSLL